MFRLYMQTSQSIGDKDKGNISSKYRPEIDGLRGIAVIAVIINHFSTDLLPSGYLGVDIFFVISGFVITSSLWDKEHNSLKCFLGNFYKRRFKRLMPALIVCLIITGLLICIVNPDPQVDLNTGVFAAFGLSNMYLLKQATDYFAASTNLNPFTQTWSLGVEEQFYLIFPLILWFSGFARKKDRGERNLTYTILFVTTISIIAYVSIFMFDESTAYFLMPTRFWEMSAGCLTYITYQKNRSIKSHSSSNLESLISLILIIIIFISPKNLAIFLTIAIVLITCRLLLRIGKKDLVYSILEDDRLKKVGIISYSLYLWHWPILAISRWTIGIHWWSIPFQLITIVLISILSYEFIECKMRYASFKKLGENINLRYVSILSVLLTAGIINSLGRLPLYAGGTKLTQNTINNIKSDETVDERREKCSTLFSEKVEFIKNICYKDKGRDTVLIGLVGDSMANSMYKIIEIEVQKPNISTFFASRSSCIFPQPVSTNNNCSKWSNSIENEIIRLSHRHSKVILIINGYYQNYFDNTRSLFQPFIKTTNDYQGYLEKLLSLSMKTRNNDIEIWLTLPVPVHSFNLYPECVTEWFRPIIPYHCKLGTEKTQSKFNPRNIRENFNKLAARNKNINLIDPMATLCNGQFCNIVDDQNNYLYIDSHHLSDRGTEIIYNHKLLGNKKLSQE